MEVVTIVKITVVEEKKSEHGDEHGDEGGGVFCCLLVLLFVFIYGPFWANSLFRDEQNLRVFEEAIGMTVSSFTLIYIWFFIIFLIFLAKFIDNCIIPLWLYFTVIPFFSFNELYFLTVQFIMTLLLLLCACSEKKNIFYTTAKLVPCLTFTFYYCFEHIQYLLYLTLCSLSVLLCFIHTEYEEYSDCFCC